MKQPNLLRLAAIAFVLCFFGAAAPSFAQSATDELALWNSVKESSDPAEFKVYLKQFPDGMFADVAKERFLKAGGLESDLTNLVPAAPAVETPAAKPEPAQAETAPAAPKKAATQNTAKTKKAVVKKASTKKVATKRASTKKVAKNRKAVVRRVANRDRVIRRVGSNRGPVARLLRKKPATRRVIYQAPIKESGGGGGGSGGGGGGWGG